MKSEPLAHRATRESLLGLFDDRVGRLGGLGFGIAALGRLATLATLGGSALGTIDVRHGLTLHKRWRLAQC